jgi:hypothetical protein
VIWFKSPFYTVSANNADIPDGDPTETALADALRPVTPAAVTPEFPWPAGALVISVALAGGAVVLARRRQRSAART